MKINFKIGKKEFNWEFHLEFDKPKAIERWYSIKPEDMKDTIAAELEIKATSYALHCEKDLDNKAKIITRLSQLYLLQQSSVDVLCRKYVEAKYYKKNMKFNPVLSFNNDKLKVQIYE